MLLLLQGTIFCLINMQNAYKYVQYSTLYSRHPSTVCIDCKAIQPLTGHRRALAISNASWWFTKCLFTDCSLRTQLHCLCSSTVCACTGLRFPVYLSDLGLIVPQLTIKYLYLLCACEPVRLFYCMSTYKKYIEYYWLIQTVLFFVIIT